MRFAAYARVYLFGFIYLTIDDVDNDMKTTMITTVS